MQTGTPIEPQLVIIAGPNGAGKSTSAPALLPAGLTYVNADEIASSLDATVENRDLVAGRRLLAEWTALEAARSDFAVETTLASRSMARRIKRLRALGYRCHLVFIWLPDVNLAVGRVAQRVRSGGHDIPAGIIRRRYGAGVRNFLSLYRFLVDTWTVYSNLTPGQPDVVAWGRLDEENIVDIRSWEAMNDISGRNRSDGHSR